MGFLTQHAALTNAFEVALQQVAPSIALPYWDYTFEGELVRDRASLAAAWDTELWTDAWFGRASGELHAVTTGRFAYQRIGDATNSSSKNPYFRRADLPSMNRGAAAAATWIFRGDEAR